MKYIYKYSFAIVAVLTSVVAMAQPPGPPATPIDGGLSLLLVAGSLYGAKKIADNRKK
jgi:hypothetical protein